MRSLKVNLGAPSRGLAHAGDRGAGRGGADGAREACRGRVLGRGGRSNARGGLGRRGGAGGGRGGVRLGGAAFAVRGVRALRHLRHAHAALRRSSRRCPRRGSRVGGDEDFSETGQTRTTRKDARATDRGGTTRRRDERDDGSVRARRVSRGAEWRPAATPTREIARDSWFPSRTDTRDL